MAEFQSTSKKGGIALLAICALAFFGTFIACRKPPPDEAVYTGRKTTTTPVPVPTTTGTVPPDPDTGVPFTKAGLLTAIADCAVEHFADVEAKVRALRDAAHTFETDRTDAKASAAKTAWLDAMASFEEAEVFRFGPGGNPPLPGAKSFRDSLYAWPHQNRCKVDEQIVAKTYAAPNFATTLVTGRGLAALEYLIFYGGNDNGCSSLSALNSQGTWAAVSPLELSIRKAAYAAVASDDALATATSLSNAWLKTAGNFHAQLATAGAGSVVYATQQDAFNSINDGLFYVEIEVKDLKVGRPAGIFECENATCPDAVESPYARASTAHIHNNLVGFRKMLQGCGKDYGGLGFDDWLRDVGAGDLADRMLSATVASQSAIDALNPPLEQALVTDIAKVQSLHATLRGITDPLKTEFVTVLNLELPKTAEGDND